MIDDLLTRVLGRMYRVLDLARVYASNLHVDFVAVILVGGEQWYETGTVLWGRGGGRGCGLGLVCWRPSSATYSYSNLKREYILDTSSMKPQSHHSLPGPAS